MSSTRVSTECEDIAWALLVSLLFSWVFSHSLQGAYVASLFCGTPHERDKAIRAGNNRRANAALFSSFFLEQLKTSKKRKRRSGHTPYKYVNLELTGSAFHFFPLFFLINSLYPHCPNVFHIFAMGTLARVWTAHAPLRASPFSFVCSVLLLEQLRHFSRCFPVWRGFEGNI